MAIFFYPFTEPLVMPATRYLRNTSAATAGGMRASIPAAATSPYWMLSFVTNSETTIAIGLVSMEEARIRGIWN